MTDSFRKPQARHSLYQSKESKVSVPGPGYYDIKPMFADVPKYILNKVEWDWYTPIQIFWDLLFWFKPLKFIRLFLQEQSEQFLTNFKAAKIFQQAFYCFRQISPDVHSNCSKLCFLLPSNTVPKWVHNLKFNGKQTLKIDLFRSKKRRPLKPQWVLKPTSKRKSRICCRMFKSRLKRNSWRL